MTAPAAAAVSFVSQKLTVGVLFQLSDRIEVKNDSETANMEEKLISAGSSVELFSCIVA